MAKKHVFGLASATMGAIAGDGGMGTVLTAVGETVSGTAELTTEDNTVQDFTIEESDSPIESIITARGAMKVKWSSYDVSASQMVRFFGGTKVTGPPETWTAPDTFPDVELSLKLTDKNGTVIDFARVKVNAKFSLAFAKDKLGQVDIEATILQPTKVAEPRLKITYAA